jgi:hypothetical protein
MPILAMFEVGGFLAPVVSDVLKSIVGGTAQKIGQELERHSAVRNLRIVIRERLKREINFNLEILKEDRIPIESRIEELDISVVQFLFSQPLPLNAFLTTELPANAEQKLKKLEHRNWSVENYSEVNLLERIWLRISVAKMRSKHCISPGDVEYLGELFICLFDSLKKSQ